MKAILCCLLPALLLTAGCKPAAKPADKSSTASPSEVGNPLTAPADYVGAVSKAQRMAGRTVNLANVQNAIRLFHAQEERYPGTLQELVSSGMLRELPQMPSGMKLQYDPKTGQVSAVNE